MKIFLFGLVGAMAISLTACRAAPASAGDAALLAQGEGLYTQYCAECHGAQLEGQPNWKVPDARGVYPAPPHDATGHTWHHPDALLLEIIANGGSMRPTAMPAFGALLNDHELEAVLAYIKHHWGKEEAAFQEQVTQNAQE